MAGNHKRRKRKIDLNGLSVAKADNLAKQLGEEIAKIMDEANNRCNEMLKIYGLRTQIGYEITELVETIKKKAKSKNITESVKRSAKL